MEKQSERCGEGAPGDTYGILSKSHPMRALGIGQL
jgi:hypothetical protein